MIHVLDLDELEFSNILALRSVCKTSVKLIFTGGPHQPPVAFRGTNVILGLYK